MLVNLILSHRVNEHKVIFCKSDVEQSNANIHLLYDVITKICKLLSCRLIILLRALHRPTYSQKDSNRKSIRIETDVSREVIRNASLISPQVIKVSSRIIHHRPYFSPEIAKVVCQLDQLLSASRVLVQRR